MTNTNIVQQIKQAKQASLKSAFNIDTESKNKILKTIAKKLKYNQAEIINHNKLDIDQAKANNLTDALIDRLTVTDQTIDGMINSIDKIINLDNPCSIVLDTINHANGLIIKKISVPIGVIAIIYESRPNVTLDAAALCIKSGNVVILKGGKEAVNTNRIIADSIKQALQVCNTDPNIIQFIDSTDRQDTLELLKQDQYIDIIIPRGGTGLINFIYNNTKIPVLKHLHGVCHTYVDQDADIDMACNIIINAKCQRPGVCNAMETLLIHKDITSKLLLKLLPDLIKHQVELRVCDSTNKILDDLNINNKNIKLAEPQDWTTEYLDLILSIRTIDNIEQAIEHINHYGSHHSDCIVTNNSQKSDLFMEQVDSATVYHNASTRFTDGEEFGMGAEMGISTDKLHARGPVGLKELTTYKYKIYGAGQIRD